MLPAEITNFASFWLSYAWFVPVSCLQYDQWFLCSNGGNPFHMRLMVIPCALPLILLFLFPPSCRGPNRGEPGTRNHWEENHSPKPTHWTAFPVRNKFCCVKPTLEVCHLPGPPLVTRTWRVARISYYREFYICKFFSTTCWLFFLLMNALYIFCIFGLVFISYYFQMRRFLKPSID